MYIHQTDKAKRSIISEYFLCDIIICCGFSLFVGLGSFVSADLCYLPLILLNENHRIGGEAYLSKSNANLKWFQQRNPNYFRPFQLHNCILGV